MNTLKFVILLMIARTTRMKIIVQTTSNVTPQENSCRKQSNVMEMSIVLIYQMSVMNTAQNKS